jgi:hypothetical protein
LSFSLASVQPIFGPTNDPKGRGRAIFFLFNHLQRAIVFRCDTFRRFSPARYSNAAPKCPCCTVAAKGDRIVLLPDYVPAISWHTRKASGSYSSDFTK